MRKFKLFLSLLMLMAFSVGNVWGADPDVTYDFTGSDWSVSDGELTNGTVSFTGAAGGSKGSFKMNSGYFMLGKKGAYLNFPTYSSAVKQIVVTGRSGASGSTKMNIYVGNTAVSTETTGSTGENSYDIATASQTAGTTYTLNVTSDHNAQITKIEIYYAEAASSCTKTVSVTKVTPTNGDFAISATEVCGDGDGGEVTISDIEPATGYALDEVSVTVGTYDKNTGKVTGITNDTEISVTFKELQKYTVSFITGAGNPAVSPITETTAGAGIILPAGPTPACSANGWIFAGWAAEAVASETTTAPTLLSGNYKPTDNVTLFAVYKRTEGGSGAGAEIGATLFNEEFNGLSASDQPTAPSEEATVYGSASVSYTCESTYAKIYAESSAGGASPEMLIPKSDRNGYFEISNIPTGAASALTLTYRTNQSGLSVTSSTDGISIGNATGSNPYSRTITIDQEKKPASFDLKFAMTTSSNGRLDNISIIVETSSAAGTTYYLSAPSCCTKHSVNVALGIQYGKVEADLAEACEGTEVTLTATPNEHCSFVKWDVKQGETPVAVSDNKFTMPDADVTVSATFKEIRNAVNVVNPGHGTITVTGADNLENVLEGTELSVEVSGAGYEFTLKAYKEGEESTIVPITDGKLTMPAYGIVITADEQELVSPTILVNKDVIDFGKAVKGGAAPASETFTISGANLTGDLSLAWEESDGYFTWTVTEGSLTANAGIVEATISVTATEKAMNTAGTLMDNMIISGGGAIQKEVLVGVEVQQTYTAKWFVNGEELTESTQTAVAGTDLIVPTNPTKLADDCDDMSFKGWAEAAIEGKQDDAPAYTEKTKMPEANVNFYAVFASEVQSGSIDKKSVSTTMSDYVTANSCTVSSGQDVTMYTSLTLDENITLSTTGEANCGSFWNTSASDDTKQWRLYQNKSGNATVTALNGYELKNVTITYVVSNSGILTDLTSGVKTEVSGTSVTYTVGNTGTATNGQVRITAIDVEYEKNDISKVTKDYMTTCQSCGKVNLMKAATEHGSYTFQQSGIAVSSVKTCEAATVDVVFEPAEGYELANFQISELDGVSYADGVITIAQNAAGNLTTTATFAPKNYSVTMTQTGYAEATLSEDQTNKHIGNEITISTNEPEGYYFVGWEATPTVAFADAKAPNTTFTMPASDVTIKAKFAWIRPVADALSKIPNENDFFGGAAVEGYVSGNISYNDKYKSLTYDVRAVDANGFLTGDVLLVYSGKGIDGADFSSENDIKVGAKVRIYGDLKNYNGTPEFTANSKQFYYAEAANPSVVVYGDANKKNYYYNEKFEFDGLKAKQMYGNGYAVEIASPSWSATPKTVTESGNVAVTATYADVTSAPYDVAVTKLLRPAGIAWSATEAEAYMEGHAYTLPAFSNPNNLLVSFSSTVEGVAMFVGEELKLAGAGETVIKATFAGDAEYADAEVSYTLHVYGLESVTVEGNAEVTAYEAGDTFNRSGLSAKANYRATETLTKSFDIDDSEVEWVADPTTIQATTEKVTVSAVWNLKMGSKDINVAVYTHKVEFEAPENGKLAVKNGEETIASGNAFAKGTVLTVEATPTSADYRLDALTVNGNDIKAAKEFTVGTELKYTVVATFAEKAEAGIAWSAAEATAVDYEGAVNALPTLTNAASLEVAYESTNAEVAEIAANGDVTIKAAGTATIKAIFAGNETYKAATVTYELTVSHVPVVKLAGSFNDWTGALLTPNEDYTEASVKVNFAADSWPLFKMIVDDQWRGLPMDGGNYYLFHRDWNTVEISDAGENIQLKADFEGEYTFTWTYATNTLTITFPDMPEPEYYIAGDFTSWETNMAKMTEGAGMYKTTVTINATEPQEFKVVRVQGPYKTWYGLAGESTMTPENCTNWIIGGGDANIGLQPSYAGKYTFYFNVGDMQLTIDMPTEPGTALDNTEAGETAAKVMQNGQLLIIKNGKTFNAQGAVVK